MTQPFIGEIRMMPYSFAPRQWAYCNGQPLAIAQNTALYSIVETTYGGDGINVFNLPNLQGRAPMHSGHAPGLSSYRLGEASGTAQVALSTYQMPSHSHGVRGQAVEADASSPNSHFLAQGVSPGGRGGGKSNQPLYTGSSAQGSMNPEALSGTGASGAHENRQPYLGVQFCIALFGVYPERS